MKRGGLVLGILSGVAVVLLFSSMPGGDRFDVRAGALPLYAKNSSEEIVFSREAILARIRQDLGLSSTSSIRVANLPGTLKGPQGGASLGGPDPGGRRGIGALSLSSGSCDRWCGPGVLLSQGEGGGGFGSHETSGLAWTGIRVEK